MLKKHLKILTVFIYCVISLVCFLCVIFAVLAKPQTKTADITESRVEYSPKPKENEYFLISCDQCESENLLVIDFEQKSITLSQTDGESFPSPTAKIKVNEEFISALVDNAGGINFTLYGDTDILKAGSWRLTGNQVWRLLHADDYAIKEALLYEVFDTVFMFGLKNDQIYIILEKGICDNLSYTRLYDIAQNSKEWLSSLNVIG